MTSRATASRWRSKIAIHHIGARWGSRSFPILKQFEQDFVNVLYEADADAIDAIRTSHRESASELIVIQACLAESDAEKTLYVLMNPGGTSTLPPAEAWDGYYVALFGIDFDFPMGAKVVEKRQLKARSLDSLLADNGSVCPSPDFLSLDTQGSEYDILIGASKSLSQVLGLIVEVEFVEMYRGQKRFQDVCDLLDAAGFSFVRFQNIGELFGPRAAVGFRGRGYQSWADALFLRRPQKIKEEAGGGLQVQLEKLCFFAITFGIPELAVECLDRLRRCEYSVDTAGSELRYRVFVKELFNLYQRWPKLLPPVFSEILPAERVKEFSSASQMDWPRILDLSGYTGGEYSDALKALQSESDTEFETTLRNYGFDELATQVNLDRRRQALRTETVINDFRNSNVP